MILEMIVRSEMRSELEDFEVYNTRPMADGRGVKTTE